MKGKTVRTRFLTLAMCITTALCCGPRDEYETTAAKAIEQAVMEVKGHKLKGMGAGKMGYSTSEVGDLVADGV